MEKLTIIVADDMAVMRDGVAKVFRLAGLDVVAKASSGAEAVKLCRMLRPDWVSLDFEMPEIDGVETAVQIRKVSPGTHIAFFSVKSGNEFVRRLARYGHAYFAKAMMYVDTSLHEDIGRTFEAVSAGRPMPMESITEPLFWSRTTLPGGFLVYEQGVRTRAPKDACAAAEGGRT